MFGAGCRGVVVDVRFGGKGSLQCRVSAIPDFSSRSSYGDGLNGFTLK